ncbi:MAG: hypothetical protein DDT27_00544 [Dehalococcoidia bacterium]|nr:hypothetical protein [Chloroflexota bacterium]
MTEREVTKRISINPKVCHGKPCIKGTRVMAQQILDLLAGGLLIEEIISEDYFPDLTKEDVLACIAFANQLLKEEEIHFYELETATP